MQSHCLKLEQRSWGNKDAEQLLRERRVRRVEGIRMQRSCLE